MHNYARTNSKTVETRYKVQYNDYNVRTSRPLSRFSRVAPNVAEKRCIHFRSIILRWMGSAGVLWTIDTFMV